MKIGLFGIAQGAIATPGALARIVTHAEAAGIESVWTGEHVVLPDPQASPSPVPPGFPMLHPSTALAFIAAITSNIKLGTGITLIAQRNPVVLAKEMASLDVLSGGRLLLGIGAGYLHQEFAALGVNFDQRGARTDEYVHAMRALWNMEKPEFSGQFVTFKGIDAHPRPVQAGGPPIVVGGASTAALRRAWQLAQGWYGFAMTPQVTGEVLARLKEVSARYRRGEQLGDLEISITPAMQVTQTIIDDFAALGVHRLSLMLPGKGEQQVLEFIDSLTPFLD